MKAHLWQTKDEDLEGNEEEDSNARRKMTRIKSTWILTNCLQKSTHRKGKESNGREKL